MPPQTQFELDGETLTTLAAEATFLEQVAAETSASLTVAGHSTQGRTIHRLDLGAGDGQTLFITSLVHGDEVASREALLPWLRDLAYSTDPAVLDYLAHHRIVALTPCNPDGQVEGTRTVPFTGGLNINRDTYRLVLPETRVIMEAFAQVRPHLALDIHEFHNDGTAPDYLGYPGGNPLVHQDVQDLAEDAYQAVSAAMVGAGHTADYYWPHLIMRAGVSTTTGPMHSVGLLNETNMGHDLTHRVALQRTGLDAARAWHEQNAALCTDAARRSRETTYTSVPAVPLYTQTYFLDQPGPVTLEVAGYQLSEPLPATHDAFGIEVDSYGFVTMRQEAQHVIPTLLDPQSPDRVADASPVPLTYPTSRLRPQAVAVSGVGKRPILQIRHHVDGTSHNVRLAQ